MKVLNRGDNLTVRWLVSQDVTSSFVQIKAVPTYNRGETVYLDAEIEGEDVIAYHWDGEELPAGDYDFFFKLERGADDITVPRSGVERIIVNA